MAKMPKSEGRTGVEFHGERGCYPTYWRYRSRPQQKYMGCVVILSEDTKMKSCWALGFTRKWDKEKRRDYCQDGIHMLQMLDRGIARRGSSCNWTNSELCRRRDNQGNEEWRETGVGSHDERSCLPSCGNSKWWLKHMGCVVILSKEILRWGTKRTCNSKYCM